MHKYSLAKTPAFLCIPTELLYFKSAPLIANYMSISL